MSLERAKVAKVRDVVLPSSTKECCHIYKHLTTVRLVVVTNVLVMSPQLLMSDYIWNLIHLINFMPTHSPTCLWCIHHLRIQSQQTLSSLFALVMVFGILHMMSQ